MNREELCITQHYTIKETIDIIKSNHQRGAIVLSDEDKVCGFVSQGDILQALIDDISLYAPVSAIIRPNFFYSKTRDLADIIPLFKKYTISMMPIVDDDFRLLDVVTLGDVLEHVKV